MAGPDPEQIDDVEGLLESSCTESGGVQSAPAPAQVLAPERGRPINFASWVCRGRSSWSVGFLVACLIGVALLVSSGRAFPSPPRAHRDSDTALLSVVEAPASPDAAVVAAKALGMRVEDVPADAIAAVSGATIPAATTPLSQHAAVPAVPAMPAPETPAAPQTKPAPLTSEPFDCNAGFANWKAGWSDPKKEWCCANKHQGCQTTALTTAAPPKCVAAGEDCRESKCCSQKGQKCFVKTSEWATCKDTCKPGVDTSEPPEFQQPWECSTLEAPAADAPPAVILPCAEGAVSTCPGEWLTGTIGGYMCEGGGCRGWDVGPFPANACKNQCSIGHIPTSSTVTTTTITVTSTYPGMGLKLLCWSLARVAPGDEMNILNYQLKNNCGIFACDSTRVLSFDPHTVGDRNGKPFKALVVGTAPVGMSKDGTSGNALQFMKAWDVIREDGEKEGGYKEHDWTIKADPDAVLLPDRMRMHLAGKGGSSYVRNCDKPMSEGTMMFGSMEVLSKQAIITFFSNTVKCYNEVPWQSWGEDLYLMRCLEHLGVTWIDDYRMTQDGVCKGVWCGDPWAAAFHPMKSVGAWDSCWKQAIAAR